MRCRDVQALDSAYLDGELDDARASAVRGHLRVCQACSERVADLATLIAAASRLEPVEPGPSLWAGIERGLAEAEIADSRRSWLWLRWQAIRPRVLPVTVAVAAAALLVVWTARRGHQGGPAPARTEASVAGEVGEVGEVGEARQAAPESVFDVMGRDVAEADQRYVTTIAELRAIVDEERAGWPEDVRAAFDARLREFEDAARGHEQMVAAAATSAAIDAAADDPRARDALYAVYRAEIEFLQRAALQGPGLIAAVDSSAGGRP